MSQPIAPPASITYYRPQIYWNDFEIVRCRIDAEISGSPTTDWVGHLKSRGLTFDRCLMLNCGNGWVERDLYRTGLFREVFGFDIGEKMVDEATEQAKKMEMPARYVVADCNNFVPERDRFDLAVNFAAMHHVAYINRLTARTTAALKPGGRYVAFDYVGPHRNQYSWKIWSAIIELNATLPIAFRHDYIPYPHLKTMLHLDPTEAIHSELQVEMLKRYFDIAQYTELGGALAYHLLYGNAALFEARHSAAGQACLNAILDADKTFTTRHPDTNLFAFWIAAPKAKSALSEGQMQAWQADEDAREAAAALQAGRYYPPTALEILTNEISDLRYNLSLVT